MTFATLRAMVAGLSLGIIAAILRRPIPTDAGSWIALCSIGLGAASLAYFGMIHAAEFVSPGLATILTNTQLLIAAVLAFGFCPNDCELRNTSAWGSALWGLSPSPRRR